MAEDRLSPQPLCGVAFCAEEEGFEPSEPCSSTVFKTVAFGRSATLPGKAQHRSYLCRPQPVTSFLRHTARAVASKEYGKCLRTARGSRTCAPRSQFVVSQGATLFLCDTTCSGTNWAFQHRKQRKQAEVFRP